MYACMYVCMYERLNVPSSSGIGGAQRDGVEHGGVSGPHREEGQPTAAELLAAKAAALPAVRPRRRTRAVAPGRPGGRRRGRPRDALADPGDRAGGRAEGAHGRDQRPTPSQPAQGRGVRPGRSGPSLYMCGGIANNVVD